MTKLKEVRKKSQRYNAVFEKTELWLHCAKKKKKPLAFAFVEGSTMRTN